MAIKEKLDIGCGSKKEADFTGIDLYQYDGVDVVWDLTQFPWPFEENSFSYIKAEHVIEHIQDLVPFFQECHRIAKPGAVFHLATPHFSSIASWSDPTHVHHLSTRFPEIFCGGYLSQRTGEYEILNTEVTFYNSFSSLKGRLVKKIFGLRRWEKYYAFRLPGHEIFVDLKVIK